MGGYVGIQLCPSTGLISTMLLLKTDDCTVTVFLLLLVTILFPFCAKAFMNSIMDNSSSQTIIKPKWNQCYWENSSIHLPTLLSVMITNNKTDNKQLSASSSKPSALLEFLLNFFFSRSTLNHRSHVWPRFLFNTLPRDQESYYTPVRINLINCFVFQIVFKCLVPI